MSLESIMNIDVNSFCSNIDQIIKDKTDKELVLTGIRKENISLSDEEAVVEALSAAIEKKDYRLSKALNQYLAYIEVKNNAIVYKHLPVIIHAEISSFCNCECIMCTHCYEKNDRAKYLDLTVIERFLPTCRFMVINGIGELFIHPGIVGILSKLKEYQVQLSVTTNAQYIPTDALPIIGDIFKRVCVSCDGASKNTYEKIRRGSSFDTFRNNCRLLRATLKEGSIFTMSVVSMKQNLLETVDIVHLAKELGFDEVRFGRLSTNPFIGNENDSINNYPNLSTMLMDEAVKTGEEIGIKVVIPVIYENEEYSVLEAEHEKECLSNSIMYRDANYYENLYLKYKELYRNGIFEPTKYSMEGSFKCNGICHWVAYGININSDSQLRPCGEIVRGKKVDDDQDLKLANLMNNSESMRLREVFNSGMIPDCCINCSYLMGHENELLNFDSHEFRQTFIEV